MKAILLAAALLLAACGGKQGHPRVRIANVGNGLQTWCMPITLADSLGYYKDEGLDVRIENLPSSSKALEALVGESTDVAGIVYSQTIEMAAHGRRLRSIVVINRGSSNTLVIAPHAAANVHRAEDLRGKLIGVPAAGAATHQWAKYYLGRHGLQPDDFRAVSIGMGASAIAAFESGRVDAAVLAGGDHLRLLRLHPGVRILMDSSTPEGMREGWGSESFAGGTLSARQEWLDRNAEAARKLARAVNRAREWALAHKPEEIRARLPESFRSQDEVLDCRIIDWGRSMYTPDGRMPEGAPEALKRYLDATLENVRSAKIDLAATWTNEFLEGGK